MNQSKSEVGQGGILGLIILFLIGIVLCYILFFVGWAAIDPIRDLLNTDFKNSDEVCSQLEVTVDEKNVVILTNNSTQDLTVHYSVDFWSPMGPVRFKQTISAGLHGTSRGTRTYDGRYYPIGNVEIHKLYSGDGTVYRCNSKTVFRE